MDKLQKCKIFFRNEQNFKAGGCSRACSLKKLIIIKEKKKESKYFYIQEEKNNQKILKGK